MSKRLAPEREAEIREYHARICRDVNCRMMALLDEIDRLRKERDEIGQRRNHWAEMCTKAELDNRVLREALEYYAGQGSDRGHIAHTALERTKW